MKRFEEALKVIATNHVVDREMLQDGRFAEDFPLGSWEELETYLASDSRLVKMTLRQVYIF